MSSSKPVLMATKVETQPTCHFMRLPTEIREMIYRPLVIARHAMVELRMNREEAEHHRLSTQVVDPDQEYSFETAILATNRRIHEEVRDLCRRENDFICFTSWQPSRLMSELENYGMQMIAKLSRARNFWNISMTLTLDSSCSRAWPRGWPWCYTDDEVAPEDGRPYNYIFCSDELPGFCETLLNMSGHGGGPLEETVLYINISSALANGQVKMIDDHPVGRARMEKLLGPLRRLHSLGAAQIDGPLSGSYKGEIIRSISKDCPFAMDIVHETIASLEEADEQASKDQLRQANLGYKAALIYISSCCWRHGEWDFVMSDGPFPGLEVRKVVKNIEVRLLGRIAAVYYKSNKLRMARIYTGRALDPRRPYNGLYVNYHALNIQPWENVVYAEVLHVAALISYTHGNVSEAVDSLLQAYEYVPFDEEQESRYEAWQAHADRLTARRDQKRESRERHVKNLNEKAEAMIEVICNWKRKGERLFQSGRSYLASSVYQTALKKIERLHQNHDLSFKITGKSFQGYSAIDVIKILAFGIAAGLAAASLESENYEEVVAQTDATLTCEDDRHTGIHPRHQYCSHSYSDSNGDWAEDRKHDYIKIHHCRAMALYHLGDTVTAVEHMEEALRLDPGDNAVFRKLTMLKKKLAKEAGRKTRLEKLNRPQNQLRKKQERRRTRT